LKNILKKRSLFWFRTTAIVSAIWSPVNCLFERAAAASAWKLCLKCNESANIMSDVQSQVHHRRCAIELSTTTNIHLIDTTRPNGTRNIFFPSRRCVFARKILASSCVCDEQQQQQYLISLCATFENAALFYQFAAVSRLLV
jgi:hypothetical protein